MQDKGIKNVVIRNIVRDVKNGSIDTPESLDDQINHCIKLLELSKKDLHDTLESLLTCKHEYRQATFTVQKMIFGYIKVYEHVCKFCKHTEKHQMTDKDLLPEWTENAKEQYYNNNI